jgi:hypothetical protein
MFQGRSHVGPEIEVVPRGAGYHGVQGSRPRASLRMADK